MSEMTTSIAPHTGDADAVRGNLICVAAMAMFALSFPLADILLKSWGPLALIGARNALGLLALIAVWRMLEPAQSLRGLPWARGIVIGAVGFGIGSTLLLVAQSMTDAVTVALVVAVMPLAAVGVEVICDGRRLTIWFAIGLGLVLFGGALATGAQVTQAQIGPGLILGVISTVFYSWGSRATVKGLPGLSVLTQTTLTMVGMAVFSLSAMAIGLGLGLEVSRMQPWDNSQIGIFVAYTVIGLAISQVLWVAAVARIGVGVASFHINAVPFYVMLILVTLGGSWNSQQVIGAAIVVAGVILSQKRKRHLA